MIEPATKVLNGAGALPTGSRPSPASATPTEVLRLLGISRATARTLPRKITVRSRIDARSASVAAGVSAHIAIGPVVKVATRTDLARRWHDLMDVNAGRIADGEASVEDVGWELFHLLLDVASGRRKTWAEHWKLHNALVLFNPAPVT